MSTATQKCECFRFTDPHNYSGEKCDAAATNFQSGERANLHAFGAAHEAQWKKQTVRESGTRNGTSFAIQDRNARYVAGDLPRCRWDFFSTSPDPSSDFWHS